jgi:hypothetical protein
MIRTSTAMRLRAWILFSVRRGLCRDGTGRALGCLGAIAAGAAMSVSAQTVALEQQVKAAYLFNFTKFVEWPADAIPASSPFTICVADHNPFGPALATLLNGETIQGHRLTTRVVRDVHPACQVLFFPRNVPAGSYLRRLRTSPVLTVGATREFLTQGGIINFIIEDGKVRFEIDQEAATRAGLKISSRLLRLAPGATGTSSGAGRGSGA